MYPNSDYLELISNLFKVLRVSKIDENQQYDYTINVITQKFDTIWYLHKLLFHISFKTHLKHKKYHKLKCVHRFAQFTSGSL